MRVSSLDLQVSSLEERVSSLEETAAWGGGARSLGCQSGEDQRL